jgi:hypothetical protein
LALLHQEREEGDDFVIDAAKRGARPVIVARPAEGAGDGFESCHQEDHDSIEPITTMPIAEGL